MAQLSGGLKRSDMRAKRDAQPAALTELTDAQRPEAFLSPVEGLLADSELATDLADRRAGLRLKQGQPDLLVDEFARLHPAVVPSRSSRASEDRRLDQNATAVGSF